jgi:hypothetical protein
MEQTKRTERIYALAALFLFILCALLIWWVVSSAWAKLSSIDTKLAVGLLTASTTIVVAALTVSLGRYLERKKEIEAHFREKKVEIYDEFLKEFFKLFGQDSANAPDEQDLVSFLKEWQRKMILWGGAGVLSSYLKWKKHLGRGEPNAQSLFLTDDFFKAIRKDLGLSNRGLEKGAFAHFMLKNAELFLQMAKENPDITLAELGQIEEKLG